MLIRNHGRQAGEKTRNADGRSRPEKRRRHAAGCSSLHAVGRACLHYDHGGFGFRLETRDLIRSTVFADLRSCPHPIFAPGQAGLRFEIFGAVSNMTGNGYASPDTFSTLEFEPVKDTRPSGARFFVHVLSFRFPFSILSQRSQVYC